jgi:signal transduction histidine kinase
VKSPAEALGDIPYFSGLDAATLEYVLSESDIVDLEAGTEFISEGSLSDEMYVVLDGDLDITKKYPNKIVSVAQRGPGDVIGEIAFLEKGVRTASATTIGEARLLRIPSQAVESLLDDPVVIRQMFQTMTLRLREIEAAVRREEQMASLGRMAAQLMHELNNPAAAIGRTSELLSEVYETLGKTTLNLAGIDSDERILWPKLGHVEPLTGMARAAAADTFSQFLIQHSVEDRTGELADSLVESGISIQALEEIAEGIEPVRRPTVIEWFAQRSQVAGMLAEISASARRISELVAIVRSYTFLDQAPIQTIDPIDGIDDTLLILKHELKNVEVQKNIDSDLNQIEAPGRNLNQVWANLIENAIDAMDGVGTLSITGENKNGEVVVSITDTGSGIDLDVQDRIFEPFFTTKEPGKGTGLGLHTVHNTVTRAGGTIDVSSGPAGTTFTLRFPSVGVRH